MIFIIPASLAKTGSSCTLVGNVQISREGDLHGRLCFEALSSAQLQLYSFSDFNKVVSLFLLLSSTLMHFATTIFSSTALDAGSNDVLC